MKVRLFSAASALALALVATPSMALERPSISVGPSAGTTGVGGDISLRFSDHWGMNIGHQQWNYDTTYEDTDLTYDSELNLDNTSITAEFYPTGNRFFISAGLIRPDNFLDVTAVPNGGQYEFNGNSYDSSDVESISGYAGLGDDISPYVGIGFKSSNKKGLGFFSEIGVYKLDASANLNASYSATADPAMRAQLDQDLQKEENELKDSIDKFGLYPVAKMGIQYTF
jgi:hypothetical protein